MGAENSKWKQEEETGPVVQVAGELNDSPGCGPAPPGVNLL